MNNFKKVALSLLVAGLAVGFSAFRTSEKKAETLANTYYVLISNNSYQKTTGSEMPSLDSCQDSAGHPCIISFATDPGQNQLDPNNLPSTPNYHSPANGLFQ